MSCLDLEGRAGLAVRDDKDVGGVRCQRLALTTIERDGTGRNDALQAGYGIRPSAARSIRFCGLIPVMPRRGDPMESTSATTSYHRVTVDGVGIFYREAGPRNAPTIVLLHGFPSSSREFDSLIPLLATRYHAVAPNFPGFGQSDAPPPSS